MKKIFLILFFSIIFFTSANFVLAQNLDEELAPNNQNNDQALRNLVGAAYMDSTCVPESTDTTDNITGESNSNSQTTCANTTKSDGVYFIPNVSLPGFASIGQPVKISPDSIALYINAVYKYGAGFAGLVAIFMIVFAAWQWIMAAGNSGKIDNAKDTIIASLVGLTLLFGGYLLLSQISNRLVNLKSLEITPIVPKLFEKSSALGVNEDCSGLQEAACQMKSDICLWDWNSITNTGLCVNRSLCDISFEVAYAQRNNNRLICCADGTDFRYALKGSGIQNSCEQICGDDFVEKIPMSTFCGRTNCMQLDESACKTKVGFCRWIEDGENRCLEEAGQEVEDMDCNEDSDCSIYNSSYCCNSADFAADECRLRTESGVVCY